MQKYIVWDFNGTILDDASLSVHINNLILKKRNLPEITLEQHIKLFDFPMIYYYEKIGLDSKKFDFKAIAEEYNSLYMPLSMKAPLRNGVKEALQAFEEKGYKQIILSASYLIYLEEQIKNLGILPYFETLLGLSDIYAVSKVDIAKKWINENNVTNNNMLIIGDTTHDFHVANEVGCEIFLLTGGHNDADRLKATGANVFDNVNNILSFLNI